MGHPENSLLEKESVPVPSRMVMAVTFVQLENAAELMVVTELGITILVRLVQPVKRSEATVVILVKMSFATPLVRAMQP